MMDVHVGGFRTSRDKKLGHGHPAEWMELKPVGRTRCRCESRAGPFAPPRRHAEAAMGCIEPLLPQGCIVR